MPAKLNYDQQAVLLAQVIDIAIDSFKKYPLKDWQESHIQHMVTVYVGLRESTLTPAPKFKNMQSFKYVLDNVFTYFQEGSGKAVDYFWQQIKQNGFPYKRENKMAKIFKTGKIKDDIQYDFVIDCINPYYQDGLINEEQVILLNSFLAAFENEHKTG